MAALIAIVAICLFAAGVVAGITGVVAVAIRREERNLTLTSEAPDNVTRAARWLNGSYVRAPRRTATGDREKALVWPAPEAGLGQAERVPRPTLPVGLRLEQRGLQP
jgi:hypothetical protein